MNARPSMQVIFSLEEECESVSLLWNLAYLSAHYIPNPDRSMLQLSCVLAFYFDEFSELCFI